MDSALNVPVTGMSLSACLEDEDSLSVTLLVHIRPGVSVVCHMYSALNIPVAEVSLSACLEGEDSLCGLPCMYTLVVHVHPGVYARAGAYPLMQCVCVCVCVCV